MHYSALIVQRRLRSHNGSPAWEDSAPTLRIPCVTNVSWAEEDPGGFTEASFTIPTRHARYDPQDFRNNTLVWLYDGATPCFYGHIVKAIPQPGGDVEVTLDGAYRKLDATRMRIVWADGDLSQWQPARGNTPKGSVDTRSDGSLRFSFQGDTPYSAGTYLAADYFLFGEAAGPRDHKYIDGVRMEQDGADFSDGDFEFRIYGMTDPGDSTPDLLYSAQNNNPVSRSMVADGSSGDDPNGWPNTAGYRCIRVGLWCINAATPTSARTVSIATLRVSTRAAAIKLLDQHQTSTLVRDLWDDAGNGYDAHHLLQEEYIPSTGEAVVGAIDGNGQYVGGVSFKDWVSPREILESLADTDGQVLGMWFPTRRYRTGSHVVAAGVATNYWYRQPPELTHRDWPKLSDPDYLIRLGRGAQWEPDGQGDEITEATYANYSTSRGQQRSVFVEDTDDDNWLYQQGWHEASDWQIDKSVGDATAATQADRYNRSKRQPTLSGTITITTQTRAALATSGGGLVTKLSTVHCGTVAWIIDAKGHRRGRITRVEYTAATSNSPEQVVLTVNGSFATHRHPRRLARMSRRAEQTRSR